MENVSYFTLPSATPIRHKVTIAATRELHKENYPGPNSPAEL